MSAKLLGSGLVVLGIVAVVVLAVPSFILAEEKEDKDDEPFSFQLVPFEFEALFTDVDTNSSKFEEYRDMETGGVFRRLRLFGEGDDRNRTFDFDIKQAGRDDARYTMRYRNSGKYAVKLDYNIIPHRFGNDATLLHSTASGPGIFTLSDTTQQTLQDAVEARATAPNFCTDGITMCTQDADCPMGETCVVLSVDFNFLRGQLQPFIDAANIVDTRLERQRARATVDVGKLSRLSWKFDLQQETRGGSRPYGATFGFSNAIELLEPIRYDTKIAEASGEWKADRGGLRFGLNVSHFSNMIDTIVYDNPWRISDTTDSNAYTSPGSRSIGGPSVGRNALGPDNRAGRVFVAGHARLGQRGWLDGMLSFGRMEQDDPLLPHTINTAITPAVMDPAIRPPFDASDPANLPASSASAEVDVLHFTANVGTKIADWASVKFRARYYDYDNKSPVIEIPGYVRMDAVWEQIPRNTVPYAYTRSKYGVEFGFDPARQTHVGVGYDLESWDRDFREIRSSDDDIFHVTVDSRALKNVVLRGGWEHGNRTTDQYVTAAQFLSYTEFVLNGPMSPERVNNQFELRKYDEAERTYDEGRISASVMASSAVNFTLGVKMRDVDYEPTVLVPDPTDPDRTFPTLPFVSAPAMGLLSEEFTQFDCEVSYTPHERLSMFAFGSRTDRETFQRARQSGGTLSTNPADNWELTLDEATDTWGLGLNAKFADRWTLDLSGSLSDSDGDSLFFSPPGGSPDLAESFPEYDDNKWLVYSGALVFHVNDNVKAGLTLRHDEFETNRFSRLGLQPYLPGTLILDLNDGDYDADLVMVGMRITY